MKLRLGFSLMAGLIALTSTSCNKDFLDRPPIDQIVVDNFYQNRAELRMATASLYNRPWWDFNVPFIFDVGDVMSGNAYAEWNPRSTYVNFAIADGDQGLKYGWSSLYNVIANCNATITNINAQTPSSVAATDKNAALAEAKFMRATAYFYLVRLWGPVPLITNSGDLVTNPRVPKIIEEDIYRFITEEYTFSAEHLPTTDEAGRVTRWAAKGMLAKVYLTLAGKHHSGTSRNQEDLNKAKAYAEDVVKNSGLTLFDSYYDLFLRKNKNNRESLFSLQWVALQAWGSQNTWQANFAPDGEIASVGDGWSGAWMTADLYTAYAPNDRRRKATFMLNGDKYPELTLKNRPEGYTYEGEAGGIKKYVIGGPDAPGNDGMVKGQHTDISTYMLRLADVYLLYAEAILGNNASTSDGEALQYFNLVHQRAGLDAVTSIDQTSLLHERRLEFALEHQFWFDILRLHDYDPTAAEDLIAAQHRNDFTYSGETGEFVETVRTVVPTINSFILPYPAVDVVANPKLKDEPVPFY